MSLLHSRSNPTDPTRESDSANGGVFTSLARALGVACDGVLKLREAFDADGIFSGACERAVQLILSQRGRLIVTGVGKSGHIGRKIAATLASTGTPAYFVHPTEAGHGDLGMISPDDTILCLSWSGETSELTPIVGYSKRFGVPIVSLCANPDSTLARNSAVAIVLPKVQEACPHGLAPTTSTLIQLAVADAIAIALLESRGFSAADFQVFHPGGKLGAQLRPVVDLAHSGDSMPILPIGSRMSEAILVMSAKGFGVVAITDLSGALVGVITDGDLRRHMHAQLLETLVETVMSKNPKVVPPEMLAGAALRLMEETKVNVLFVVDHDSRPIGIVHVLDLVRAGVA